MKKGENYKPKFKRGDIIIRNDNWYSSFAKATKTHFVNPYHKPFINTLTVNHINISNFDTFIHKGYVFKEQLNCYDCTLVDKEYDLYDVGMRKAKIKKLCTKLNSKQVML